MTLRTSGWKAKNGMTCLPGGVPLPLDRRVLLPDVTGRPGIQGVAGGLLRHRTVDRPELAGDLLAVLVVHPAQRRPDQVDDAGLDRRARPDARDGGGQAGQAVADHEQDVLDAAGLELAHDAGPELRALGRLDPDAQDLLAAVCVDTDGQVRGLVRHHTVVADLADQRVQEDHRVDAFERPGLPLPDFLEHRVGDLRKELAGDVQIERLLELRLDRRQRQPRP